MSGICIYLYSPLYASWVHILKLLALLRVYGHYIYISVTCQNIFGASQNQEHPIMWCISPQSVPIFVIFLYHIIYHCLLTGSWLCTQHHPEQQPESKHPYTLLLWIDAWCLDEHRFTMQCLDSVWCQFYLLIQQTILKSSFFYISSSAQAHIITLIRALLATIWNNGDFPCPQCTVKKNDISNLGYISDIKVCLSGAQMYLLSVITSAVNFVYERGLNVASSAVEHLLSTLPLVPTWVHLDFLV